MAFSSKGTNQTCLGLHLYDLILIPVTSVCVGRECFGLNHVEDRGQPYMLLLQSYTIRFLRQCLTGTWSLPVSPRAAPPQPWDDKHMLPHVALYIRVGNQSQLLMLV